MEINCLSKISSVHEVISSEHFAEQFYANLKQLTPSKLNNLREMISSHSIYYSNKKQAPCARFWTLLKNYITNTCDIPLKKNFVTTKSSNKETFDIVERYSRLLNRKFIVLNDGNSFKISSSLVKRLLEIEKLDIQVHKLEMNEARCGRSDSCSLITNYTIFMDCGYPLNVNASYFLVSMAGGNRYYKAVSVQINGDILFEWTSYDGLYFHVVDLNNDIINGLFEGFFKKNKAWEEINLPPSISHQELFKVLFMKLLDPTTCLIDDFDEEYLEKCMFENGLPLYRSHWKRNY